MVDSFGVVYLSPCMWSASLIICEFVRFIQWLAFVPAMLCFLCVPDNNGSAPTVSSCSLTWHIRSSSSSIRFDLSSAPIAVTQGSQRLLLRVLLCRITMVTTRSRRTSSSAATDHSPSRSVRRRTAASPPSGVTPTASPSRPSSSRRSRSSTASRASPHPPASHFVSPVCATRYTYVICHRPLLIEKDFDLSSFGPTFVDFLTRHRLLPLVRGLPLPNFQIIREFYANFPDVSAASVALSGLVVRVRGVAIPLSFHFISAALGLPPIRSGSSCEPVPDFLPCRQLVNRLYVSPPEVLPTELSSGMMSQWTRTLYMLVRNYLNPTSQHGKVSWKAAHILFQLVIEQSVSVEFYVRESLIVAGAANATVPASSLVLPRIVTALAAHARVPALPTDDIGSSDSLKVNNQVTLHRSDAHCTSGGFSIEQQALLDSLSASHQVTHALLRRIWNRLDTYSELLLSVAGHIQPTAPPRSPRARSI
ncbi:unnamed protein product [Prunus armeniaca]|uniref:Uncharacterized protein n=1 Tax=Prunus armeniaca TaxID=36596 RepID=A0A6J5U2P2_PRUAR|nr:unnamed protein product [Prunus armeniaca]